MTTLQDCAKGLRDVLAPLGFIRKSSTWHRDDGEFIDVIEFQRFRFSETFTVNVGVLTKSAYKTAWGEDAPASPQAAHCTINDRISDLFLGRSDFLPKSGVNLLAHRKSWELADPTALPEIADRIQTTVLPFLSLMHSRHEQMVYLSRSVGGANHWLAPMSEAILMYECGEQTEACSKLRNYKAGRYGHKGFEDRANEIADRLTCPKL
jgi:hypothetical protein